MPAPPPVFALSKAACANIFAEFALVNAAFAVSEANVILLFCVSFTATEAFATLNAAVAFASTVLAAMNAPLA